MDELLGKIIGKTAELYVLVINLFGRINDKIIRKKNKFRAGVTLINGNREVLGTNVS
jgi:hypothetical protein